MKKYGTILLTLLLALALISGCAGGKGDMDKTLGISENSPS